MKRLQFIALLVAVLLCTACARPADTPQDTTPTLPSIQTNKTPLELLTEAITNAKNADNFTIQFGTITTTGDDAVKDLHTQQISPAHPLDWDALYAAVPQLPTNEQFLTDFCSGSLRAIPSNTGIIRYELAELTQSEMDTLMYGQASETPDPSTLVGTAAIEVDEHNRFTRLELVLERDAQSTVTILFSVQFP